MAHAIHNRTFKWMGAYWTFLIQKCKFFSEIKEIDSLRGGRLGRPHK
jgi:hypothetical protein